MSNDIKRYKQLIESALLNEGRADDLLKQSITSLENKFKGTADELDMFTLIKTVETTWKKFKSTNSYQHFPNTWKIFLADVLKSNMLDTAAEQIGDQSIAKKAKYKKYKSRDVYNYLEHLTGINYAPIQNFNPLESKSPVEELEELEQQYIELSEENFITPSGNEKVLIDFGDMAWFDLGKGSCKDEADAMGHCGNAPSEREGDRIFSLRKKVMVNGVEYHKPHLTFIFNDGFLGEMKGRANDKPAQRYHKHIFELLKLPIIEGIIGGGFEPENNFELSDFNDAYIEQLRKLKGDEFVDEAGNTLLPVKKLQERFNKGDESVAKRLIEVANEYIEDEVGYYSPSYELYEYKDGKFKVYAPEFDIWELKAIDEPDMVIDMSDGLSDFKDFIEEHFVGNLQTSIYEYILSVYKDDIMEFYDLEEDEIDIDTVESNFNEIVENIADNVESALNTLYRDAAESGAMNQIIENVKSSLADFTNELHFETITPFELIDGEDFSIKDNNVYEYIRNLDGVDDELSEQLNIEQPYYGYNDFDDEHASNESFIKDAFDMEGIELSYFIEKSKKED